MVQYKKITVSNYKTISYAELEFEAGIYKVIGNNQDSRYLSNGSGKTTLLHAIALCLYNRDISGVVLDHLSNRVTKKGFCIVLDLLVDGNVIKITNDRNDTKKMSVIVDDILVAQGVTNSLAYIENMLGMGFETFKLTHYITSATITHLTQNLSQPTLFNDILHIIEIQELDKILLQISKEVTISLSESKSKLTSLVEQEKLLGLKNKFDKVELESTLETTEEELEILENRYGELTNKLKDELSSHKDNHSKLEQAITTNKSSLKNGICSQCNTILLDKEKLEYLNVQLKEAISLQTEVSVLIDTIESRLIVLNRKYHGAKQELVTTINKLKQEVGIATEIESFNTDGVLENKNGIVANISELEQELLFVNSARKEIKTGKIIKEVMDKFFKVIEFKLKHYSELINLEQFKIRVLHDKLGMAVQLEQNGLQVPVDSLSNGEKTRLSLLILISMLDAMKAVTDSNDNYLVFDEASSSFDKSGIEELEKLFSFLKNLGQSCFIITHGSEMDQVPYDKELLVTKHNGMSTIEVRSIR
jgi:DNA repair exonuclease SbcCD ATPase subunit